MKQFERWLQERLVSYGANIKIDGDWGRESIAALKQFQQQQGIAVTGVADAKTIEALRGNIKTNDTPNATMPPWMAEMYRRMGLHEVRNNKTLIEWLKIGKYLGNPKDLPWCGDAVETCFAKVLPNETLPSNPFFAQNWAKFGINTNGALVGSVGVIKWSANSGHVGFVAAISGNTVYMLGGNQSNAINISAFNRSKFIAFRWPSTFPITKYPPLREGIASGALPESSTR